MSRRLLCCQWLTSAEEMLLRLGRSVDLKGNERSAAVVDLLSFDSEKELIADEKRLSCCCDDSSSERMSTDSCGFTKRQSTGGDLLPFDSKKELVVPSLQSTERRWAMALTGALGRENKGYRRDDADERV
ncbi:hypothetical protein B296_00035059 [Ensete ventricosum]|uniref:Uncharacterized protein n=1 Tax=Ensete ventricosum TaxID=4639 RepID=A0A426X2E3_ENSVE|nr:hypothetical protein B296_00035059 [Ensete ventricosum]